MVKDLVDWSEQEQRLWHVLHESPGASRIDAHGDRLPASRSSRCATASGAQPRGLPVSEVEEAYGRPPRVRPLSRGGSEVWVCRSATARRWLAPRR